jgi:hypothetical protein
MTDDRMALVELLQKSGEGDFLRAVAEAVLQILMETDAEGLIGAGRNERSAEAWRGLGVIKYLGEIGILVQPRFRRVRVF